VPSVKHRSFVTAAEEPFERVSDPIQGLMLQVRGDPIFHRTEYPIEIDVDASYDYASGIRATAWELRESGRFKAKRFFADRQGQGPNHAELCAAIEGLRAGHMYSDSPIHLRTDNKLSAAIITNLWQARQRHIEVLSEELQPILESHEFIALTWVRTREVRRVDAAAREIKDRLRQSKAPWLDGWKYEGDAAAAVIWRLHNQARKSHLPKKRRRNPFD